MVPQLTNLILNVQQLASVFECSTEKIKRKLRGQQLPGFKFGKNWFVRVEDLEKYLASAVESTCHLRRPQ